MSIYFLQHNNSEGNPYRGSTAKATSKGINNEGNPYTGSTARITLTGDQQRRQPLQGIDWATTPRRRLQPLHEINNKDNPYKGSTAKITPTWDQKQRQFIQVIDSEANSQREMTSHARDQWRKQPRKRGNNTYMGINNKDRFPREPITLIGDQH